MTTISIPFWRVRPSLPGRQILIGFCFTLFLVLRLERAYAQSCPPPPPPGGATVRAQYKVAWTNLSKCGVYEFTNAAPPNEPHTPTKARAVPTKINAAAASQLRTLHIRRKAHLLKLNSQTPCPPRGAVPVN